MGGWVGMPFQGSTAGLKDNINSLASPGAGFMGRRNSQL